MNLFNGKNVLVAGASGFIGINLVNKLLELGANVRGTYYTNTKFTKNKRCQYIKANLENKDEALNATNNIDFVFMCAANTSGAAVIDKQPLAHLTPNLIMNARILEASYSNSVEKLCFISSNTVYPMADFPVKESDTNYKFFEKYHIVGWMKFFSEQMCKMYSTSIKNPMDTLVVRPGNIYGPYDKFDKEKSKVIAALIRRAVEREDPFLVWGDGNDIKDFIYIDDFIDGMLTSFTHFGGGEEVNIASGREITIKEIIKIIFELEGLNNIEIRFDTTKPSMIPKRLINTDKIKNQTGFSPQVEMHDGLLRTLNWYKDFYSGTTPEQYNAF